MIDQELQSFIEGPVIFMLASVGEGRRMAIGRASGVRVAAPDRVQLLVSRWQWPDTIDNLLRSPSAAVVVASPVDYTRFQLKGRSTLCPAVDADVALAERYISDTYNFLSQLGVPAAADSGWLSNRALWLVDIESGEVFAQTPGPMTQPGHRP